MATRLNKYLADRGVCSRRAADTLIESGKVKVNGLVASMGLRVEDTDEVSVNGKVLENTKPGRIVLMYNKPIGVITSVDPNTKDNIIEKIGLKEKIFPIGRLDVASSGLILLTNDGPLSERITHPRFYHEKEYVVEVDKPVRAEDLATMAKGMVILGSMTKPAKVTLEDESAFRIVLTEGRNRQIRRMCEALGYEVRRLTRVRVVNMTLGDLQVGAWRYLDEKEIHTLEQSLNNEKSK